MNGLRNSLSPCRYLFSWATETLAEMAPDRSIRRALVCDCAVRCCRFLAAKFCPGYDQAMAYDKHCPDSVSLHVFLDLLLDGTFNDASRAAGSNPLGHRPNITTKKSRSFSSGYLAVFATS